MLCKVSGGEKVLCILWSGLGIDSSKLCGCEGSTCSRKLNSMPQLAFIRLQSLQTTRLQGCQTGAADQMQLHPKRR